MRHAFALLFIVSLSAVSITASAQTATGVPQFSSTAGGPDILNLGNLNVHLNIPVFSKPGRGIPFSYVLGYDSSVWYPVGASGSQSWQPAANWGWVGQTQALTGYMPYTTSTARCFDGIRHYYNYTLYHYPTYVDQFAVQHPLHGAIVWTTPSQCNEVPASNPSVTVTTSEGDSVYVDDSPSASVTDKHGNQISPPVVYGPASGTFTDNNGNQISTNGSSFTDTLGTTALTISGSNPQNFTFTNSNPSPNNQSTVGVTYSTYTLRTNFGCSGISQYGPTSVQLISSIGLPDGSSYSFTYEPTPGYPGDYTGRIASITLPTGGTITYAYPGGNNGITCSDGTAAGLTRTTPDGTTTYSRSGSGSSWTTTVTDAASNQTVLSFQSAAAFSGAPLNFLETKRQIYSGSSTLLRTIYTCYNGASPDCSSTAVSLPITQVTATTKLDNNYQSRVNTYYNGYELPTETDEYDFGNGSPGGLLRKTIIAYASLGNNIVDRVSNVTVQDGSGTQTAYTSYGYDETAANPTSGVPQHVAVSGSRGNLTSVNQWLNSPAGTLSTYMTYDDTGNVLKVKDPGGHTTTLDYTDNFSDHVNRNTLAYIKTVTLPQTSSPNLANHQTTSMYDVNTGLVMSSGDQNGNTTTYTYDAMLRPSQTNYPDGGKTVFTYSGESQIWIWSYLDGSNYTDSRQHIDSMGRPDRTAYLNYQGSWDMQDTCFDADGRVGFVSYPYQSAAGWGNPSVCSGAGDSYSYDGLNRTTGITHSDGSSISYSYAGRAIQVQDEGNGSYNVTRISQVDGLGRLAYMCEKSSGNLLGSGGTAATCQTAPGQNFDLSATGFVTTYGYDTLNNLTHVDQGGYATRTYAYDSLSRMTSESFPEQFGCTTSYSYNNDSLLTGRTRPAPNQGNCSTTVTATSSYDELHRLRSRSYSDGVTPTATFNYDESTTWGVGTSNALGRLTTASSSTGEIFPGADAMGRILSTYQCTPRTCGSGSYYHVYGYDYLGDVTSFNNTGLYALTEGYNSAARLTSVTSNLVDSQHPGTIVSGISYGPFGISSDSLGNGINESFGYAARGALSSYSAGSAYSFSLGFASNYGVTSANDSANGNWAYAYDQFNRLVSSNKSAGQQMFTYAYDRFGNRWHQNAPQGGPGPQYTFDIYNRINNPDANVTYDVLGNVINDGYHNYAYDAENRMSSVDSGATTYVYDALGRRVAKQSGGVSQEEYLYDLAGEPTTVFNSGGVWAYGEIYAGGRHLATYSGATTNFLHTDWLGNLRVTSNVSGGNSESCSDLPFGDNRSCSGTDWSWFHFTGDEHDGESNLEHTQFRQLSTTQGRWLSPDPYLGSMDLTNPQSLNRYAYVMNGPMNMIDPSGLHCALFMKRGSDMEYCQGGQSGGFVGGDLALLNTLWGAIQQNWVSAGAVQTTITYNGTTIGTGNWDLPGYWSGFMTWATSAEFLFDWATGTGKSNRVYGPNAGETAALKKSIAVNEMRMNDAAHNCSNGKRPFNLSTPDAAVETLLDPLNGTAAQLGGWAGSYTNNGNGTTTYHVVNNANLNSFAYHIFSAADKVVDPGTNLLQNNLGKYSIGPGSNIHQDFNWTEGSPCN